MNMLDSVRMWLARLLLSVRPGEAVELPWPNAAISRSFFVSRKDPKWAMVVHQFPDGMMYGPGCDTPFEQTADWDLKWIKPRPVEKSQSDQAAKQNEAKT